MSEETEQEGTSFFQDISTMLDALIPPTTVSVLDVNGKEHNLPGAISARRQVVVFREFQNIWKNEKVAEHLSGAEDYAISNIINAVMLVSFEEEVLESLGRAFKAAFPEVSGDDPLDRFSVEEVVTALVPLFMRFIKRAGKTLVGIGELTTKL